MHACGGPLDEGIHALLHAERSRLVRLCATLSGDAAAAEDLAQDALLEAWRHRHKLQSLDGAGRWLSAIAWNVCLRRRRTRDRHIRMPLPVDDAMSSSFAACDPVDDVDVELELERAELARLLDQALALLSPEARMLLIERYIEDLPQAEVAARLGLSEPAVAMRAQRGKLALRRILATELRDEAASYGLLERLEDRWEKTRIWCWKCGGERLLGRITHDQTELVLRCPRCCAEPEDVIAQTRAPRDASFAGMRSYTRAVTDLVLAGGSYFEEAATHGATSCILCGRPTRLLPGLPAGTAPYLGFRRFVHLQCEGCGSCSDMPLHGITMALSEARALWEQHGRVRMVPERETEVDGQAAILTTLEAMESTTQLHALYAADSCRLLSVRTTAGSAS